MMYYVYLDCDIHSTAIHQETNFRYLPHLYNQQYLNKYSDGFTKKQGNLCKQTPPPPIPCTYQPKFVKEDETVLLL